MYSTVPPWLRHKPSLIIALTGEPGRAFPLHGSEVVSSGAGVRLPFTAGAASLRILPGMRVFVTAFLYMTVTQFGPIVKEESVWSK